MTVSRTTYGWVVVSGLMAFSCARGVMEDDVVSDDDNDFTNQTENLDETTGVGGASTVGSGPASGVGGSTGGCAPGQQLCDTVCVDVSGDTTHCGACNNVCGLGDACNGGQCVPAGSGSSSSTSSSSTSSSGTGSSSSSSGAAAQCEPISPAQVCGAAMHCTPTEQGTPSCVGPAGSLTQYDPCATADECGGAYECVGTAYATVYCMQWCANDLDCPSALDTCNFLSPSVYVGATEWGVCYDGLP